MSNKEPKRPSPINEKIGGEKKSNELNYGKKILKEIDNYKVTKQGTKIHRPSWVGDFAKTDMTDYFSREWTPSGQNGSSF